MHVVYCQDRRETTPQGLGFIHAVLQGRYQKSDLGIFLYENNSISADIKQAISDELKIMINSALVSAKETYWTNIPNITQPR